MLQRATLALLLAFPLALPGTAPAEEEDEHGEGGVEEDVYVDEDGAVVEERTYVEEDGTVVIVVTIT